MNDQEAPGATPEGNRLSTHYPPPHVCAACQGGLPGGNWFAPRCPSCVAQGIQALTPKEAEEGLWNALMGMIALLFTLGMVGLLAGFLR